MKSNMHTHTSFCDGKNKIEAIIRCAVNKGFDAIGFSSHAYTGLKEDECGMSEEGTNEYFEEIARFKKEYENVIDIYAGLEEEALFSKLDDRCDYKIISCHYVKANDELLPIDLDKNVLQRALTIMGEEAFFDYYYSALIKGFSNLKGTIVGHLDLYTKFDEQDPLFNEIPSIAYDAIDTLASMGAIFEVNTGAMARGYRSKPYPSAPLLKHIKEINGKIIITSDCHNMDLLDYGFDEAKDLLLELGFRRQVYPSKNGFIEIDL